MQKLMEANLRLVIYVAKQYSLAGACMDRMDVIQDGNIGLARAIELFDPSLGYRFSTYAYSWIHQTIRRGLTKNMNSVRLPDHLYQKVLRVTKRKHEWMMAHDGQEPDLETLAELSRLSKKETQLALDMFSVVTAVSLQTQVNDDGDTELGELLTDPEADDIEITVMRDNFRETIERILDESPHISERDKDIFLLRLGWDDGVPRTLEEVGNKYGITRERARQIEAKVMRILRGPKNMKELIAYRER
jgi:RNA polymerase sigma factor (sigma-70 family)